MSDEPNLEHEENIMREDIGSDTWAFIILLRIEYERNGANREDYIAALDWVLDSWRSVHDVVRKRMTNMAAITRLALEDADGRES